MRGAARKVEKRERGSRSPSDAAGSVERVVWALFWGLRFCETCEQRCVDKEARDLCYSPLVLTSFEDQLSTLLVVSRVVLFRFRRSLGWCRRHAPLAIAHRHHLFSNQSGSRQTQQLFGE